MRTQPKYMRIEEVLELTGVTRSTPVEMAKERRVPQAAADRAGDGAVCEGGDSGLG